MWIQFSLWCTALVLSSGLAIAALLYLRRVAEGASRLEQLLAHQQQQAAALGARSAEREAQLARHVERQQALQHELSACNGRLEAALQRCDALQQESQRRVEALRGALDEQAANYAAATADAIATHAADQEAERVRLSASIAQLNEELAAKRQQFDALGGRCGELEVRLAGRDAELARSEAEIQALREAVRAGEAQVAARPEPDAQPEQMAQRPSEQDGWLEQTLRARVGDLEQQLATSGAELESLRARVAAQDARGAELEQQLQRAQRAEHERARHDAELQHALCARAEELETRIASQVQDLAQRSSALDALRGELDAERRRAAAALERCAQLDSEAQHSAQQEKVRLQCEQEVHQALCARADQLEAQLAARGRELDERSAELDRVRGELAAQRARGDAADQRVVDLEQAAQRRALEWDERQRMEGDTQRSLCARIADLEAQVGQRDTELGRRGDEIAALRQDVFAQCQQLESEARRAAELESELQRRERSEQELQRTVAARAAEFEQQSASRAAEFEQQSASRAAEFERQLASRAAELELVRTEAAALTQHAREVAAESERRRNELRAHEARAAEASAQMEALSFAIQSAHEEAEAGLLVVDELAAPRIAALHGARRVPPQAYLDGIEGGDLRAALQGLLGSGELLSERAVDRLCERWRAQHAHWQHAPFEREVVYLWTEAVPLAAGHADENAALLTVVASFLDGSRALVAVESGTRASKDAWVRVLRELGRRGMNAPRLVVAAGSTGCAEALAELGWSSAHQRCWNEQVAALLAALPRSRRAEAGRRLRALANAGTRAEAKPLLARFVKRCGVRHAAVGEALRAAWSALTAYQAFPEEHWPHLRTSGLVEARLAALHLRADEPRAARALRGADAVVWKLLCAEAPAFRALARSAPAPSSAAAATPAGRRSKRRVQVRASTR